MAAKTEGELASKPSPAQVSYRVEQDSIDARTAWEIRSGLLRALYLDGPDLWVDLEQVLFIDSTGLGMLIAVLKEAREMNGGVYLMSVSREVSRTLQVTGVKSLFE